MPLEFEKQKPQPLMLGDKAHYTLSSYDPVHVEVEVPYTNEEEVSMMVESVLAQMGATEEDLKDEDWIKEHFEDVNSVDELYAAARAQISEMNAQVAEQQKVGMAVAELTKRLQQAVPTMLLARYRQSVMMNFQQQLAAEGLTVEQFMANSGATQSDINRMLDEQALRIAEQEAALDAYAREKKLSVMEDEIAQLLGFPEAEADNFIKQAKGAGQYEQLKDAALHAKAAQVLVAECSCTYHHESEEQGRARFEQIKQLHEQYERNFAQDVEGEAEASPKSGSGFTLV